MKVYKLVRIKKDGKCYPLFIDRNNPFRFGEDMHCEYHPTKGFAPRSITSDESIGGWHCTYTCVAEHLKSKLSNGEQRVWIECEASGRTKDYKRSKKQGGTWVLVETLKPIRVVPENEVLKMKADFFKEN